MPVNPPIHNDKVHRVYIKLDKPFDIGIIGYNWSSTSPVWIMEKVVWNTWSDTEIRNSLRDGKYLIVLL